MAYFLYTSPIAKARKDFGLDFPLGVFDRDAPNEMREYLVSTPELDVGAIIPPKFACMGPILQAVEPVETKDPELAAWLKRGPTVLIVLGSIFDIQPEYAMELMKALHEILRTRKDVQVLWKYQRITSTVNSKDAGVMENAVSEASKEWQGRLRVVHWLEADPLALLQTRQVCCFVNHGGSNSYHEAMA